MFRRFHIESSGSPLVQRSGTICAIPERSIIRNTPAYILNHSIDPTLLSPLAIDLQLKKSIKLFLKIEGQIAY